MNDAMSYLQNSQYTFEALEENNVAYLSEDTWDDQDQFDDNDI